MFHLRLYKLINLKLSTHDSYRFYVVCQITSSCASRKVTLMFNSLVTGCNRGVYRWIRKGDKLKCGGVN